MHDNNNAPNLNQIDLFDIAVIEAPIKDVKKVKRFSGNFKLPGSTILFCSKCNYVPRLCECVVTQEEAEKLACEINNFFIKEG